MAVSAQELLDLVEDAIKKRLAGGAVSSYAVMGMNISTEPLDSLIALREQLRQDAADEKGENTQFILARTRP